MMISVYNPETVVYNKIQPRLTGDTVIIFVVVVVVVTRFRQPSNQNTMLKRQWDGDNNNRVCQFPSKRKHKFVTQCERVLPGNRNNIDNDIIIIYSSRFSATTVTTSTQQSHFPFIPPLSAEWTEWAQSRLGTNLALGIIGYCAGRRRWVMGEVSFRRSPWAMITEQ